MVRLEIEYPELADRISRASESVQRKIAIAVAEIAVRENEVTDSAVLCYLEQLKNSAGVLYASRVDIDSIARAADKRALDNISDIRLFERARALASIVCAGEVDSRVAALEATYEARMAVANPDRVIDCVTGLT